MTTESARPSSALARDSLKPKLTAGGGVGSATVASADASLGAPETDTGALARQLACPLYKPHERQSRGPWLQMAYVAVNPGSSGHCLFHQWWAAVVQMGQPAGTSRHPGLACLRSLDNGAGNASMTVEVLHKFQQNASLAPGSPQGPLPFVQLEENHPRTALAFDGAASTAALVHSY